MKSIDKKQEKKTSCASICFYVEWMSHSIARTHARTHIQFKCVFYSKNLFQIYCQLFVIVSSTYHLRRISKLTYAFILNCAHVEMMNERIFRMAKREKKTTKMKKMIWIKYIEIIKKILLVFVVISLAPALARSLALSLVQEKRNVKLIDVHFWWQIPLTCHPVVYARIRTHTFMYDMLMMLWYSISN